MKIKVTYLISSLVCEGPTNVMFNIINNIDFEKFNVTIVTLIPEKENSIKKDFEALPIDIIQLAPEKPLSIYRLYSSLRMLLEKLTPDILHAHCARSLYLMCFMPKKFKRVYTIHIYPGFQHIQILGPIRGRVVACMNHFFTRFCDLPIGCAESIGWQYKEKKGWVIKCIPNGSAMPLWTHNDIEKKRLRKALGLDENVKYFIFVGRFSPEKNPDILVEVFKQIDIPNVKLIMLGNGILWEDIRKTANEKIILPGFTYKVIDYLRASDYYISTSDVEGLANTVLESMSTGLPMVLSDIPSHHEVMNNFQNDSVGYLVNPHNIRDLKEKILKVLDIDIFSASEKIKEVYSMKYTAKAMSQSYQIEYETLLAEG